MPARRWAIGALGGAALLGLAAVAGVVNSAAGPFFSLSVQTWAEEQHGDRRVSRVQGAIKATDTVTGTLRVASGFLGLRSLAFVVTEDTEIPIGEKLGWISDLSRGQLVRVAYEVLGHRLIARRVDVLDRPGSADHSMPGETRTAIVAMGMIPSAVVPRTVAPPSAVGPPAPTPTPPAASGGPVGHAVTPRPEASRPTPPHTTEGSNTRAHPEEADHDGTKRVAAEALSKAPELGCCQIRQDEGSALSGSSGGGRLGS